MAICQCILWVSNETQWCYTMYNPTSTVMRSQAYWQLTAAYWPVTECHAYVDLICMIVYLVWANCVIGVMHFHFSCLQFVLLYTHRVWDEQHFQGLLLVKFHISDCMFFIVLGMCGVGLTFLRTGETVVSVVKVTVVVVCHGDHKVDLLHTASS